ncbi:hypothetical protein MMC06_006242, partial [Schaereria dolodes]|nr:hypothetical protein [Schaereria dolodes]
MTTRTCRYHSTSLKGLDYQSLLQEFDFNVSAGDTMLEVALPQSQSVPPPVFPDLRELYPQHNSHSIKTRQDKPIWLKRLQKM